MVGFSYGEGDLLEPGRAPAPGVLQQPGPRVRRNQSPLPSAVRSKKEADGSVIAQSHVWGSLTEARSWQQPDESGPCDLV
jgi:hypothetical protein